MTSKPFFTLTLPTCSPSHSGLFSCAGMGAWSNPLLAYPSHSDSVLSIKIIEWMSIFFGHGAAQSSFNDHDLLHEQGNFWLSDRIFTHWTTLSLLIIWVELSIQCSKLKLEFHLESNDHLGEWRTLLCSTMMKEFPHSFNDSFLRVWCTYMTTGWPVHMLAG